MKAQDFSRQWRKSPLVRFALSTPAARGLSESSAVALRECGLPASAEPWLRFMEFIRTDDKTAGALEKLGYYPIGILPNGDIICIDKSSDRVMICDHEDLSYTWILNSSLESLYECLMIFDAFIAEVNRKNPRFASDFKIPDGMLQDFEARLTNCDEQAIALKGFWFTEIQALDDSV